MRNYNFDRINQSLAKIDQDLEAALVKGDQEELNRKPEKGRGGTQEHQKSGRKTGVRAFTTVPKTAPIPRSARTRFRTKF